MWSGGETHCYAPENVNILILHIFSSSAARDLLCIYLSLQKLFQLLSYLFFLQRIAGITAMLQQSLEGLLLEGLRTSSVDVIRHCLRTYATIDKARDAEALVGQVLVKPYMDEVCASPGLHSAGVHRASAVSGVRVDRSGCQRPSLMVSLVTQIEGRLVLSL